MSWAIQAPRLAFALTITLSSALTEDTGHLDLPQDLCTCCSATWNSSSTELCIFRPLLKGWYVGKEYNSPTPCSGLLYLSHLGPFPLHNTLRYLACYL